MSATTERPIVDFAEDGVLAAREGKMAQAFDELIARLDEEGLLDELTAHPWVKALDRGSVPGGGKGCAFAAPGAIARMVRAAVGRPGVEQ